MLRKTVLSLKSPTGAFIAPLRCANANLFNKVQEKLAKNKKAPARHKAEESYLLTTKLYCGKCGALMFGESGVSHTGKMYTYYKCAAAKKKKTCDKKAVRKQWLEDLVVNETMKLVEDDASMNAIIAKVMELQNQESTDLPIYEKQLKETEVGITNMLNAIQMGILTSSTKERLHAFCTPFAHLPGSGLFCARLAQPAFLCIKRELVGARFLHLLSQIVLSLKHPTGAFVASQMQIFSANKALVNSLRSSASISRMASRISLPVIFVAAGVSFCWDFHKRLRQKGRLWGVLCGGE